MLDPNLVSGIPGIIFLTGLGGSALSLLSYLLNLMAWRRRPAKLNGVHVGPAPSTEKQLRLLHAETPTGHLHPCVTQNSIGCCPRLRPPKLHFMISPNLGESSSRHGINLIPILVFKNHCDYLTMKPATVNRYILHILLSNRIISERVGLPRMLRLTLLRTVSPPCTQRVRRAQVL